MFYMKLTEICLLGVGTPDFAQDLLLTLHPGDHVGYQAQTQVVLLQIKLLTCCMIAPTLRVKQVNK